MTTASRQRPSKLHLSLDRLPQPPLAMSRKKAVDYPTSDGKPMAETDKHVELITYGRGALILHYHPRADSVYVSGNNFVFYEEGNPTAKVSPDTYVIFDVPQRARDSYKVWEEGGNTPAIVFEFTSKKTKSEDLEKKYHLYEQVLKVPEYILFDPTGDYLSPRLRGHRLVDGKYVPIKLIDGRMYSEQLGLELVVEGDQLRFYDPVNQRYLPTLLESDAQRRDAETQREAAEARAALSDEARAAAENRSERLERELEELRRRLAT